MKRVGVLRPLRERDFALLWAGMAISLLGDGFYDVAIAWQVYQISNIPEALSIVGLALTLPRVLLMAVGGVLSDRYDRRHLMIAGETLGCLSIGLLGVLSLAGGLRLWQAAALAGAYGASSALTIPALSAVVPELVPAELLPNANALEQFVRQFAFRLAGPALGGAVVALAGSGWAFVADAGSFAVAVAAVALIRPNGFQRGAAKPAWREMLDGFRYVAGVRWLWVTLVAAPISLLTFFGPLMVLLPYVVKNRLSGSASELGWVLAAGGAGAVLASVLMGQRPLPRRHITFMYLVWGAGTLPMVVFGLATSVWPMVAASAVLSGMFCAGQIVWSTLVQTKVPAHLLGRVFGLDWLLSFALVPLSYAVTGPVAAAIGVQATLVGAGLLGAVAWPVALFVPGVRDSELV